jgi:hypothetical protein
MPRDHHSHSAWIVRILAPLAAAATLSIALGSTPPATATTTAASTASAASAAGSAATAAADQTDFAVGSPAMVQAELIAVEYWNTSPCSGQVTVSWGELDPTLNATSNWWNPIEAYGNAGANSQCSIVFNQYQSFDWPMFCTVMVHEIGHLTGHEHVLDKSSVMYPIYVAPIPQCAGSAPGTTAHAAAVKTVKKVKKTAHKAAKHHAASKARKHA